MKRNKAGNHYVHVSPRLCYAYGQTHDGQWVTWLESRMFASASMYLSQRLHDSEGAARAFVAANVRRYRKHQKGVRKH